MSDETDAARVTGADDAEDAAVLAELRRMTALLDPVPPDAITAARSAIAWRTMDAELAALTADTTADPGLTGARSAGTPTLLTFDAPNLTVEIQVVEEGDRRRLLGQLVPPAPGVIEVRHRGGRSEVAADEVGRFTAGDIDPGPVSLRCLAESRVVETDWFVA